MFTRDAPRIILNNFGCVYTPSSSTRFRETNMVYYLGSEKPYSARRARPLDARLLLAPALYIRVANVMINDIVLEILILAYFGRK